MNRYFKDYREAWSWENFQCLCCVHNYDCSVKKLPLHSLKVIIPPTENGPGRCAMRWPKRLDRRMLLDRRLKLKHLMAGTSFVFSCNVMNYKRKRKFLGQSIRQHPSAFERRNNEGVKR